MPWMDLRCDKCGTILKKFVGSTAWVHLDIYAWKDSISGCFAETGGSGQAVQCMIEYLKTSKNKSQK